MSNDTKTASTTKAPDWEAIAMALGQRVNFAVTALDCRGGGGMMNLETGKVTGWREYMAEGLEMIPGVKVDREMLGTMHLPMAKRKKAQAAIRAAREAVVKGA